MFKRSEIKLFLFLFLSFYIQTSFSLGKPDLVLLQTYKNQEIKGWLSSEKLDGIRAFWDGKNLITRQGNNLFAPQWFLQQLPPFAIDGELWTKRQDFENIQSIVLTKYSDKRWSQISFYIFEVPYQKGGLLARLAVLQKYLNQNIDSTTVIKIIEQKIITSKQDLQDKLTAIIALGAEGLVVRNPNLDYYGGRTKSSLKVKRFNDDECIVKSYKPGKGKFLGIMGSIICQWQGNDILIGSGFTRQQRIYPPKINSKITFKYYGLTKYGNPKFASFLRIRKLP